MVAIDPSYWRDQPASAGDMADDPLPKEQITELGHAHRLVAVAAGRLRYVPAWRRWLAWDGRRWAADDTGEAARAVKQVARAVTRRCADELADAGDDDAAAKAALRSALRLESSAAVRGTLALAGTELGIAVAADQLDAHPQLLNVANGVLDLDSGELLDHDPELLLTKLAPACYDPHARAPRFEQFLERIQPEAGMRAFLGRLLGYGLLGEVSEHLLPIWHGAGANGKSTLITAVMNALGDYAGTTDPALLIDRGYEAHPTGQADLQGRRLVFTHETDSERRLAEGTVKRLTGGDTIKARWMRGNFFEFAPSHLMVMVTNHLPAVRGTDNGIWRRLPVVPFAEQIPTAEQDAELGDKLAAERDGILGWLLAGYTRWADSGLAAPEQVAAASAQYRHDQDALARFLADRCVLNAAMSVRSTPLYEAWKQWAAAENIPVGTQTALSRALASRGYPSRVSHGRAVFDGIGLLCEDDEP
jgi:putative DNA primase/helicase